MDGKMEDLKLFFKTRDRYARHSGIELVELSKGGATTRMKIEESHLNGVDIVHGGAVFTLADFAFAAACNSYGTIAVALQANISFLQPATRGEILIARAREVSKHPKIGVYSIDVTKETGELIARFQGTAYRKAEQLPVINRV
mgnify:CR=1 FL=1